MPAPVDELHMLALLTCVRQARVDRGEIKPERLYDIRAYKCVLAELAYLRRLHRRETGGTIVTSMPQLVKGLSRLHPAWKMDGDKFADRDRHHRAVRRRLRDLHEMGLLRWTVGVDVDGEEASTELQLLTAPDVDVDELAAAGAQLARWKARYGSALNTGSRTGIRNAVRRGRPLSASERQRRGVARARARAQSRARASTTNSHPHFEAPPSSENDLTCSPPEFDDVGHLRTGARDAHDRRDANQPPTSTSEGAAQEGPSTASLTPNGPTVTLADFEATRAARFERFEALREARQPVFDVIAAHSARRAADVASWSADRGWPIDRLREAFAVWRYGEQHVAEHSWDIAGHLGADDLKRLRRAVRRYERHVDARPRDYPEGGLAALGEISIVAGERNGRPQRIHYAIRALDQLSRRMRASNTVDDADRLARRATRLRRRLDAPGPGGPIAFRTPGHHWPAWVALDEHGDPRIVAGELVIRPESKPPPGYEDQPWAAPAPSSWQYLETLRDAYLLRGLWPPPDADGRSTMAAFDDRGDGGLDARRACPARTRRRTPGAIAPSPRTSSSRAWRRRCRCAAYSASTSTSATACSPSCAAATATTRPRPAEAQRDRLARRPPRTDDTDRDA